MEVTDALPPFSPKSTAAGFDADLVLRSSDKVDFHTHKNLLVMASPVFQDMFAFPAPTEGVEARDGLPIVELEESSSTLRRLLLLLYPQAPNFDSLTIFDDIYLVCRAVDKYQIPANALHRDLVKAEPYRVYAIACHFSLRDVAKLAACETLKDAFHPLDPEDELKLGRDGLTSAMDVLGRFQSVCAKSVVKLVSQHGADSDVRMWEEDWETANYPWWITEGHAGGCGCTEYDMELYPAGWFKKHMAGVVDVLNHRPTGSGDDVFRALMDFTQPTLNDISKCQFCSKNAVKSIAAFAERLRQQVDAANEAEANKWDFV
ncbi:hypothetical protein FB45DRAFT_186805 [Roridomyces roridus]|uniref:BTB domain-containing protein n=1 Tax=Roridomyces roridus TaxID=1738132 RepID=A0AAD7FZU3_9AGAR|nr:hypothetical protein FB45DRAFT_186805 [Roridomyces roridus]